MSSQATASPLMQRRTSRLTTWASSNQHSPELLVFQARSSLRTADTLPASNIHITDTILWSQKFAALLRRNTKARHCNRGGKRRAKRGRIVRRAASCSGGFKSLWRSDEERYIQKAGVIPRWPEKAEGMETSK